MKHKISQHQKAPVYLHHLTTKSKKLNNQQSLQVVTVGLQSSSCSKSRLWSVQWEQATENTTPSPPDGFSPITGVSPILPFLNNVTQRLAMISKGDHIKWIQENADSTS